MLNNSSNYDLLSTSFSTQASISDYYLVGILRFDRSDMAKLYEFFNLEYAFSAYLNQGVPSHIAIAIAVDNILKEDKHNTISNIIQQTYMYKTQNPYYLKELQNLSKEVIKAKTVIDENLNADFKILEQKSQQENLSPKTKMKLKAEILENPKYKEVVESFNTIRDKYDLKCSEAILDHFGNTLINSVEKAIRQYESDEGLPPSDILRQNISIS